MFRSIQLFLSSALLLATCTNAFVPHHHASMIVTTTTKQQINGIRMANDDGDQPKKGFFANFLEELDNFVDDATSRRLGNGAAFYGKRKSSFYGNEDGMKKTDNSVTDNTEDYLGPSSSGYFKWMEDENGSMTPVSRRKNVNLEKRKFFD